MDKSLLKKWSLYLGFLTFSTSFAQTFQGSVSVLLLDDFKNDKAHRIFQLKQNSKTYELTLPKTINKNSLQTGDQVTLEGELIQKGKQEGIKVASILVTEHKNMTEGVVGQRNILALLLDFTDKKSTDTVSQASMDSMLYTSNVSVLSNYVTSSSNQFRFVRVPNSSGNPGIYPITLNYAAGTSCDFFKWADDAIAAANAAGININSFVHRLYILPANVNCGFGGIAFLNCGKFCEAWVVSGRNISGLMAHELGHNLGLDHAATNINNAGVISEYGDASDFMAAGYIRQANAPHRDLQQWFALYPSKITTATSSAQFIINSLDSGEHALQTIKINKKNNTGTYYVSYRTNTEPFGMSSPYSGNVNIHYTLPGGDQHTYFVTAIGTGQTFVDSANGITISVLGSYLDCAAIVNVTIS